MSWPQQDKRRIVVDLTLSDDEDASRSRKMPRTTQDSGYHSQSQSSQDYRQIIDLDDYSEDEADEIIMYSHDGYGSYDNLERYGTISTKVVGIQHYDGMANEGEHVILTRQPQNPYDRNAIRVDNLGRQQIGHIPRDLAAKLAKYMDRHLLIADAVLQGRGGGYNIPLEVRLNGIANAENRARMKQMMKNDGLSTKELMQMEREEARRLKELQRKQKEEGRRRKAQLAMVAQANRGSSSQQWNAGLYAGEPSGTPYGGPSMEELMAGSQTFNPREIGENTEKFGTTEEDLAKLPEAKQPARITTKLLPYQLQGLAWLLEKENLQPQPSGSKEVVQLWQRSGGSRKVYTNIATNFSIQNEDPKFASGGILADDMGLGKTIEVISLIVADMERFNLKKEEQRATLIAAPLSITQHVDSKRSLNVLTYHGQNKQKINSRYIQENKIDVVITTYGTLSSEYLPGGKKNSKPAPIPRPSGLFSVNWRRVVLDEGHSIRNPNTKSALAATSIMARSRWALTGTPIINNLKDLYSLLRFIGITGGLERLDIFSSALIRPMNHRHEGAVVLLQVIMTTFCLRRKKDMPFIDLKLPELNEYVHRISFLPAEKERYLGLQAEAQGMLQDYQMRSAAHAGQKAREAYNHLLEVLLRLRQVCNHWQLCPERMAHLMEALEQEKTVDLTPENRRALQDMLQLSIESREDCPICLEDLTGHEPIITHCAHIFGKSCIARVIEAQQKCPMCRAPLDETKLVEPAAEMGEVTEGALGQQDDDRESSSSKIEALLSILAATHKEENPKVVIFSQWTRFLTLLEPHLRKAGYKYTRLDGTMAAGKRDAALHKLSDDPDTTIMLASLSVCAVGLNLVAANTVVLCDSWWAPAIEDQAVDRVHRLGQKRDCVVWRLVMDESIEERVIDIQQEKRKLMAAAFKEAEHKRGRGTESRMRDIQRLLGAAPSRGNRT